jgi:fimbrial isopeptide formation D2 family protein
MQFFLRNFRINLTPVLLRLFAAVLLLGIVLAQAPVPNAQAQAPLATLTLTKTVDGGVTTAKVGDVIFYRIHFACSSLTTNCGAMEITDVLQAGLTYLPPPDSSVPAGGYTMSYDSPTRTIKITHPLMTDGSQADAVIAVQVDYDLRPLPADINNTATGQIMPPGTSVWLNSPPAVAPTISIGTVTPSWGLTKTLYRPSINPTINTDVTYRIQLCPTTPPAGQGNTPLLNIVITDTMPVGASFVSASDSGDGLTSPGTVTWPVIAGPIYPPNCVTRYVTIRYNGPPAGTFSVGDSVTNSASANGDYTNSLNVIGPVGTITDPIIHPIDPIVEVPTYSKNDQGDPIGFTAAGRFVLSLNTNGTNYPSNSLILIDNLPPELQVTSVTSGQWASSFNYVQAYIEYSTDNGSSYTLFPDPPVPPAIEQPAGYNTNATYTAPVANITNVRWRFEYDPTPNAIPPFSFTQAGLPYGWAFTTSPQIRVTPRAVAVIGPPLLPAAVAGSTYTNCLQVSRVSSAGPVVIETCDNETMTVQGDIVSLRVSKAETRGAGWDDVGDPLINTFVSDGNLLPGDTLRYTITIEVTERSSQPLISPTILDTFPADLVFVRNGTAQVSGTGCPALAAQPTFTQPAVDQLQWDFPSLTLNRPPGGLCPYSARSNTGSAHEHFSDCQFNDCVVRNRNNGGHYWLPTYR